MLEHWANNHENMALISVMVGSHHEDDLLRSILAQSKTCLTMRWSVDTDLIVMLHAKP